MERFQLEPGQNLTRSCRCLLAGIVCWRLENVPFVLPRPNSGGCTLRQSAPLLLVKEVILKFYPRPTPRRFARLVNRPSLLC
jgi:hypothetical protein